MANLNIAVQISGVDRGASAMLAGITRGLTGMGAAALGVAAGGLAAIGAGIAGFGVSSLRAATSLEAQMDDIQSVLGGTEAEAAALKETILDLGMSPMLKVTTDEAAEAVANLARNGLIAEQIIGGAAEATVLLANATGADFGTAANIATDAMSVFKISAEDMSQAVNGIAGVTVASKFGIEDYALALAQGGGVAAAVGVEFADFNAAIAAISPLFASGSDAGTSFKTFLLRLVPDTDKAAAAMAELGLEFFNADGSMKSMSAIAGELQSGLAGLSEEQKNAALKTIFGTDAMRAAVALADAGADGFDKMAAAVGKTDAAESAKIRMDNLAGALEILGGVFDTIKLRAGETMIPMFTGLARAATGFLDQNADKIVAFFEGLVPMLTGAGQGIAGFIGSLAGGDIAGAFAGLGSISIGGFGVDFAAIGTAIQNLIAQIPSLLAALQPVVTDIFEWITLHREEIIGAIAGIGTAFAAIVAGGAIASMAAAIAGLLNPIGLLIAAGAVLGAAWAGNWGGMRDTLTAFWTGTAQPALSQLAAWLQTNLPIAIQAVSDFWTNVLQPAMAAVWEWMTGTLFPFLVSFADWWITTFTGNVQAVSDMWTGTLRPALESVWSWLSETLFPFLESLADFLSAVFEKKVKDLAAVWDGTLKPALELVWGYFSENILPILTTVSEVVSATLQPALEGLGGFISGTLQGILAGMITAWDDITAAIQTATDWFGRIADAIRNMPTPPPLFTPGSPTPFELGIRGISSALEELSGQALPGLGGELSGMSAGARAVGGAGTAHITITINGATDPAATGATVEQVVRRVLAEAGLTASNRIRMGTA